MARTHGTVNPFDTCAFVTCELAESCCLEGGCVQSRFAHQKKAETADATLPASRALNGTKPGRTKRDPTFTPRKRKPLTR